MPDFRKSESWVLREYMKPWTIEVKHWTDDRGNHWNVYVHIFPKFPGFDALEEKMLTKIPVDMPWGPSYCKWDRNEKGEVIVKTYGSDYGHIHMERFEKYSTREEAVEVFEDAEHNWNQMSEIFNKTN